MGLKTKEREKKIKNFEYYRAKIGKKKKDPEMIEKMFSKLETTLEKISESSGLTLDELADALDPSKPFPF
ncbi:hypothetical protein [Geminocystis sp. NIES-3709]|uniref:hypothetical protein n=1 Tax=Geminocystis sp. NIES-3709 TaxID=1617448 RepID=UPI0005FC4C1E|nr:hypothetical protein [Geminocystis sp. NIES-3709]BAQ67118.1 hypothetical protein GM3709_3883 [Geminocystis sp. NIES-3709]